MVPDCSGLFAIFVIVAIFTIVLDQLAIFRTVPSCTACRRTEAKAWISQLQPPLHLTTDNGELRAREGTGLPLSLRV
jgi:hypothetical protein